MQEMKKDVHEVSFEEFKAWAERNRERRINMSHNVLHESERGSMHGCALVEFALDKEPNGMEYRAGYGHARALFDRKAHVLFDFDREVMELVWKVLRKSLEERPKTLGEFLDQK